MKKIVLIVPDKIDRIIGTREGTSRSSVEVTPENLLKVLGKTGDYHEGFCFKDLKKIKVVSIMIVKEHQKPEKRAVVYGSHR